MADGALAIESGEGDGRGESTPAVDSLTRYFDEVGRHRLLSRAEEIRLARLAAAGEEPARRRLVESNLRLVVTIARGYQGMGLDLLDLIQEGNLGLMKAVERYDLRRDLKFGTYASWCIRRSICRALSTKSRTIRLPVRLAQHEAKIRLAEEQLAHERRARPSTDEVARAAGVGEGVVVELRRAGRQFTSLDQPVGSDETVTYGDVLAADARSDPAAEHDEAEERACLAEAVAGLGEPARRIIELRFGLDGSDSRSLSQVAAEIGLSRERVRKIEVTTLLRLRTRPGVSHLRVAA